MAKITVAEVKRLAMANYNNGGDGVIECYEDKDIQEDIDNGMTTEKDWLQSFGVRDEVIKDIQNS
jgi:hypothetical protein